MILYCWLAHIIRQLKTKLKNTSNHLVNYLIQLMKWWNGFSKYGQVNKIQLKRYLCPQVVRNNWNCSVITAKKCLMFTFQKCILFCKMKWTLPSKLKLREY